MSELEMAYGEIQQSMYDSILDKVSDYPENSVLPSVCEDESWEEEAEKDGALNAIDDNAQDIMTKYAQWSTETNDIENLDEIIYNKNRREIQEQLHKDTPAQTLNNRQYIDNVEAYNRDRKYYTVTQ